MESVGGWIFCVEIWVCISVMIMYAKFLNVSSHWVSCELKRFIGSEHVVTYDKVLSWFLDWVEWMDAKILSYDAFENADENRDVD